MKEQDRLNINQAILSLLTSWRTESPTETVDGTRVSFNTLSKFFVETLEVFDNGTRKIPTTDYLTYGDRTVTFKTAPTAGHSIVFRYIPQEFFK